MEIVNDADAADAVDAVDADADDVNADADDLDISLGGKTVSRLSRLSSSRLSTRTWDSFSIFCLYFDCQKIMMMFYIMKIDIITI